MEITNQDWKLRRKLLPDWQEAYMDRLNREYAEILAGPGEPSDKFWALEKRIREDKRRPGVQLEMRRSKMLYSLTMLLNDGVIMPKDLENFSDSVRESLTILLRL